MCTQDGDCSSYKCIDNQICAALCTNNGVQDGDETDEDCGGGCTPCLGGKKCNSGNDCMSGVCADNGTCDDLCNNGEWNQGETDVDCGGPYCANRCAGGKMCTQDGDCSSYQCIDNQICAAGA